jgi:dCMP deaminase
MNRPSWANYFLGLAKCISKRSHDSQTQHGCVIVNSGNKILGVGYNGFPPHLINDSSLPNTRPEKYDWMDHSETNAIANSNTDLSKENATAYITGISCFNCMKALWRSGIRRIVQGNSSYGWANDQKEINLKAELIRQTGNKLVVENVVPDLTWLADIVWNDPVLKEEIRKRFIVESNRNVDEEQECYRNSL